MIYNYSCDINKQTDTYVYLSCSNFKKNIKLLEKRFSFKFPKGLVEHFSGEKNKVSTFLINKKTFIIAKVNEKKCSKNDLDTIFKKVGDMIQNEKKIVNVNFILAPIKDFIRYQVLKVIHYNYFFIKYKDSETTTKKITFCALDKLKDIILNSIKEGEIINDMRDMVNEPGNNMDSGYFLKYVKTLKEKGLKLEIMKKSQLKKEKMNLLLAVNSGSANEPYLLTLKWMPLKNKKPIVLLGKGVTFDSGGMNLKHWDFSDMKTDMTGAAAVFALLRFCALNKMNKNVIGIIPLVENMLNEKAHRPGDIIKSHSGKNVEIINTDAEGRLILADALSYSKKLKPHCLIDIATLTGQAGSIFDKLSIVVLGNNKSLIKKYEDCGKEMNEKIWQLPLWSEFRKNLDSNIADIQNSGKGSSGTINAAMFLKEFVPPKTDWMHVDIAGVSYNKQTGATGYSILSLYELLKKI
jgi:leucyl aminopeptidase